MVGNDEGRTGALDGRAGGAAWGRKLDAPDRGAGLGAGVTVGLDVAVGGFVSSGLTTAGGTGAVVDLDADAELDVEGTGGAEGVEKLDEPGRVEEPDDEDAADVEEDVGGGVGRNGVTGAGAGAVGRVPERAAPDDDPLDDPVEDDPDDPDDDEPMDDGPLGVLDVLSDGASSVVGTLDTVGLDGPGRAEVVRALDDPSLSLESSLGSPDFTSEALTVIGDAPPPGFGRDVVSGR